MKLKKPTLFNSYFKVFSDERGYLNPLALEELFLSIDFKCKHQLLSFSKNINTFRGFHFQVGDFEQSKIIIIQSGEILDFVFPYKDSNLKRIEKFHLKEGDVLVVPKIYAHGFLTLTTDVTIQYLLDEEYNANSYKGINGVSFIEEYSDNKELIVSDKDQSLPDSYIAD